MDKWDFIQTWLALEAGAEIGKKRLRAFYTEAGRRGMNVIARGMSFADPYPETSMRDIWESGRTREPVRSLGRRIAGTALRRSPYVVGGAALGASLRELEMEDVYDAIDKVGRIAGDTRGTAKAKKKVSKFNKAVSAGMKALKKSKNYGKPGTINNGKKAFKQVTKVASKLNKGGKVSTKGISGVIKRGIGRILK